MAERGGASVIILAGGRSSRMGRPKAALRVGRLTLIAHSIAELRRRFSEIVVVAAPAAFQQFRIPTRAVTMVRDARPFQGPVPALKLGLEAIHGEVVFACSCDLPMLNAEVAAALCSMIDGYDALVPLVQGRLQPLHAVYRKGCARALGAMLAAGDSRLTNLLQRVRSRVIEEPDLARLDPQLNSFVSVNTPAQFRAALARRAAAKPRR